MKPAASVLDLHIPHWQTSDSGMFSAAAGVAGVPAPLVVGHVAALLSAACRNAPATLPGPPEAVPLRAFPPRHLPDGFLAFHAAV